MKYIRQIQAIIMGYLLFHANRVSDKKPFGTFCTNKTKVVKNLGSYTNEWQCQWMPAKECYHCNGTGIDVQYRENIQDFDDCICDRCYGDGLYQHGNAHILDIYKLAKWKFHQPRPNSKMFDTENKFTLESLPRLNDDLPPIVGYFQKKESGRKELICMYIFQWISEPKLVQYLIDWLNSTMMQIHHHYRQMQFNRNGGQIMVDVSLEDDDLPF